MEALSLVNSYLEQATMFFFDEASTDTSNTKQLTDFGSLHISNFVGMRQIFSWFRLQNAS